MGIHVSKVCSKALCHLYSIRQIRKYLSEDTTKVLVHAFVTSWLDYCNYLLFEFQNTNLIRCRGFLAAAAAALSAWYSSSVTTHQPLQSALVTSALVPPVLPVHRALVGVGPVYLKKFLRFKESGPCNLRSNASYELKVPKTKCETLGDRAFSHLLAPHCGTLSLQLSRVFRVFRFFKQALKTF